MARSIENTILILTILLTLSVRAATAQIKGMVVDATDNSPVAGATISDFYGRVLAKADIDGCFLLNQSIPKMLLVTSIGYKPQEYIVVNDGNNEIFILMEPEDMQLDEVIVTKKRFFVNLVEIVRRDITTLMSICSLQLFTISDLSR